MILKTTTNSGVTFIELLMAIGILVILIGISVPVFIFFQKGLELNNSAEEIINLLRIARNKTLASEGNSQYGVYFDSTISPHQSVLFKGDNFALRDSSFDEVYKLPTSIEIYQINLGGGNEVVFDRVTGNTSQPGDISLKLKTDSTKNKTIYIDGSGQVKLTAPVIPSDVDRIKDSRHLHFDLGWSIQDATTLKFYFPNIPQTEQIDMANYFNVEKTEFDWKGTFSVDGVDQVFRIHSHFLDAFNTLLCIHRDRNNGKSNQEVIVFIVDGGVDKDIVHYLADADDTVIEGVYGGIKEAQ